MFKSILVPIDVGHKSSWETPLPIAAELAKANGAELHLVNIVPPYGMAIVGSFFPDDYENKALDNSKQALVDIVNQTDLKGIEPKLHVAHGTIYEEILAAANQLGVDLIVMMAHRPELKDYLIGPNAARVARHADQSVMVLR